MKQFIIMTDTWSSQLSIISLTCSGCLARPWANCRFHIMSDSVDTQDQHETVHQNIDLFKPLMDHNVNIPLYTPTFGESINSVAQLQLARSTSEHIQLITCWGLKLASHLEFIETNHQHGLMPRLQIPVWNLGLSYQRQVWLLYSKSSWKFRCHSFLVLARPAQVSGLLQTS